MKIIRALFSIMLAVSLLALIGSFPVRASYASRAHNVQIIQRNGGADALFGDSRGTPIGSTQPMIIDDPKALERDPNNVDGDYAHVDEAYLKAHNIYPLQLQTVDFFVKYTRYAASFAGVLSLMVLYLINRRHQKIALNPQTA